MKIIFNKIKIIVGIFAVSLLIIAFLARHYIEYEWWIYKANRAELQQKYKFTNAFLLKALKTNIHTDSLKIKLSRNCFQLGLLSEVKAIKENQSLNYYRQAVHWDSLNCRALMGIARTDTSWAIKNRVSKMALLLRPKDARVANNFYEFGKKREVITSEVYHSDEYFKRIEDTLTTMKRTYGNSFFTSLRIAISLDSRGQVDSADAEILIADSCLINSQITLGGINYFSSEEYLDTFFLGYYYAIKSAFFFRHKDYKNALLYSVKPYRIPDINLINFLTARSLLALGRAKEALDSLPHSYSFLRNYSRCEYGEYQYPFVAGQIFEELGMPDSALRMYEFARKKSIDYTQPGTTSRILIPLTHESISFDSIDKKIETCKNLLN